MLDDDDEDAIQGGDLGSVAMRSARLPEGIRMAPAFLRTGRIVSISRHGFVIASGSKVLHLQEDEAIQETSRQAQAQGTSAMGDLTASAKFVHQADIADMACYRGRHCAPSDGTLLASIDEIGGIMLCKIPHGENGLWAAQSLQSTTFNDGESGWGGVAFDSDGKTLAAVRGHQRIIATYDTQTQQVVRTMYTPYNPARVCFVGGASEDLSLVAVAEGNQISLWDVRSSERRGCVQRLTPCTSAINVIAYSAGVLGCAGMDRSVYAYDSRKWAITGRAMGVLRSEASFLAFSRQDESIYYVAGLDSQLVCGQYESAGTGSRVSASIVPVSTSTGGHQGTHIVPGGSLRKVFEFRARGRWVACEMDHLSNSFTGVCDQNILYSLVDHEPTSNLSSKRQRTE